MKKDFNDFLATLSEETIKNIVDSINDNKHTLEFSMTQKGIQNLFTSVGIIDIQLTLAILNLYHEWLNF